MNDKIKIMDWVKVKIIGITDPYQVEKIKNDVYTLVSKEGTYEHRITANKNQLEKL